MVCGHWSLVRLTLPHYCRLLRWRVSIMDSRLEFWHYVWGVSDGANRFGTYSSGSLIACSLGAGGQTNFSGVSVLSWPTAKVTALEISSILFLIFMSALSFLLFTTLGSISSCLWIFRLRAHSTDLRSSRSSSSLRRSVSEFVSSLSFLVYRLSIGIDVEWCQVWSLSR